MTTEAPAPDPDLVKVSTFISLVLRHRPEAAGLTLDREGWTATDALVEGARRAGVALDRAVIDRILAQPGKRRFALSPDGSRIRALQGHSTDAVARDLPAVAPPEFLLHGTVARFLDAIRVEGLKPGQRQHVHLSSDEETARAVGARRGRPVVLRVAAARMARDGYVFHRAENGVWLTLAVPPAYLDGFDPG
ncbi:MAG: RNA 2'-phosphotransferase [Rhodoblastus sp.]|nr:MAG: RNA 2'-phosphotransferase [Rhodoblastus sp.]